MNAMTSSVRWMVAALAVLAIGASVGCDETGYGGYDGGYYDGGYGPIDDAVFQDASDAWSDYFRS